MSIRPIWEYSLYFSLSFLIITPLMSFSKEPVYPGLEWESSTPEEAGMDSGLLLQARDYALTAGGSGYMVKDGKLVLSWGDASRRYDLKSTTKSIGVTVLGLALSDGKLKLDDLAAEHHPNLGFPPDENKATGWLDQITIFHLATQTAGFEKPGGFSKLLFKPGTRWSYSDSGPNWLAECLTLLYRQDMEELMFERVLDSIGVGREDLVWRKNSYRPETISGIPRREFGSGIRANVDAMARIGYLYLRGGRWASRQLIPESFVKLVSRTPSELAELPVDNRERYGNAASHYGLLWWNNADGTLENVPKDAFWSWGLYDSLIVVIPSLDLVISRAGKGWARDWQGHYDVLRPFLEPIVESVRAKSTSLAPYPPSSVVERVEWADLESIVRKAEGSDNWPLTWGEDDLLYTAYGDGWGFDPRMPNKLSLGLATISGYPPDFQGANLRTSTGERLGDGKKGEKASGLIMIDGRLYMLVRNAENSRLGWSPDYGKNWSWSDWRFETSFGHPTFLNFGRDCEGARDDFVYIYSHDQDSAYEPADRMVLARVHKTKLHLRQAYSFFSGFDSDSNPTWTRDIENREAVFSHPRRCYRSSVSYNPGLKRYFWCQVVPGGDTRFSGGFGIYDAPEPWGPWTTVFFTEDWDVGPGENCSLPTKWLSTDGKTMYLVFSGDDSFSVRRVTLQ